MKREVSRKSRQTPSLLPPVRGVLQRKCACGNHTVAGGECEECTKKSMSLQRKPTNQSEVAEIPPIVHEVLRSPGQLLDTETRALVEPRFGHDFSQVRLHTDVKAAESARAVNALAYTVGRDVVFGEGQYAPTTSEGRQLMAHELTHVAQQGNTSTNQLQTMGGGDALEAEAEHSASLINAETGPSMQTSAPLHASGIGLQMKTKPATPLSPTLHFEMIMSFASVMTDADAREALDQFKKMSNAQRKKAFEGNYASGAISKLLKALPAEDAAGAYRDEVRQLLRWIEEAETRLSSGKSDDEMAELKAKDMKAKAEADAKAAKAAAGSKAAPTAAEINKAQQATVQETSVTPATTNRWDALTPRKRKEITKEGEQAIDDMVAHAAKTHPELKLTKASFKLDFWGVDDRGQGVLAMGGKVAGKPVAVVGFDFVIAVKVNPAYALSTVVHEVFGHPEYAKYGTEYHLSLYDKAVKKAGFPKKAEGSDARRIELDAYALQETEIYALMRELPFWTPVSAADETKSPGLTGLNYDPKDGITSAIGNIKTQWHDVKLAIPILHGLYARLRNDPRMAKVSLDAFVAGLKAHFTAAEVKEIVK